MNVTPEIALLMLGQIVALIYYTNRITARFIVLEQNVKHIMRKLGMNTRGEDSSE